MVTVHLTMVSHTAISNYILIYRDYNNREHCFSTLKGQKDTKSIHMRSTMRKCIVQKREEIKRESNNIF